MTTPKIRTLLPLSPPIVIDHGRSPSPSYLELSAALAIDDDGKAWHLVYAIERPTLAELPPRVEFKRWHPAEEIPFERLLKPIGASVPLHIHEQMQAAGGGGRGRAQ